MYYKLWNLAWSIYLWDWVTEKGWWWHKVVRPLGKKVGANMYEGDVR